MKRRWFNFVPAPLMLITIIAVSPLLFSMITPPKTDIAGVQERMVVSNSGSLISLPADSSSIPVSDEESLVEEARSMYMEMELESLGLSPEAFEYAWKGYNHLLEKGTLEKQDILSICDFSQSSKNKRLYILDIEERTVLINTYVAHGKNSGSEFARYFSNTPRSNKSSLGFYITKNTYYGSYGLSLKIAGVEKGINDRAYYRNIVIHGSDYVGGKFMERNNYNGRSFGCPAIPRKVSGEVINTIKDGSCLFIYYPSDSYVKKSAII